MFHIEFTVQKGQYTDCGAVTVRSLLTDTRETQLVLDYDKPQRHCWYEVLLQSRDNSVAVVKPGFV